MSEWQPIETAPKDGTRVLVSLWAWDDPATGDRLTEIVYWGGDDWRNGYPDDVDAFANTVNPPTHWMPLPEPPKS